MLTNAAATLIATALVGDAITNFNAANSYVGAGDSNTAATAAHTDLQAATNKLRRAMQAGYPARTGADIDFRALFAAGEATWTWNEVAVFNASSGGQMLARKVVALGAKPANEAWLVTVTVAITPSAS